MAYWLVKSEPETWSWENQKKAKVAAWDGVRNYQASNNLKAMREGDLAFFYHSGSQRQIVGIVQVVKEYYPDPTDETGRFGMVDFKEFREFKFPVTLAHIKGDSRLQTLSLVRQPRLSVMPIEERCWQIICDKGQRP